MDHLESFAEQRKELKYGRKLSVRFPAAAKKATQRPALPLQPPSGRLQV